MRLAIPHWEGQVSSVLDFAAELLVVTVDDGSAGERRLLPCRGFSSSERVALLKDEGVTAVICGAVSGHLARLITEAGVELLPEVSGPVDEILDAWLNGHLDEPRLRMPGAGCRRRGRKRGRCRCHGHRGGRVQST